MAFPFAVPFSVVWLPGSGVVDLVRGGDLVEVVEDSELDDDVDDDEEEEEDDVGGEEEGVLDLWVVVEVAVVEVVAT